MGINKFTALNDEEFESTYLGLKVEHNKDIKVEKIHPKKRGLGDPTSRNWVTEVNLANVQNQGACGSCWAFASVSDIEFTLKIDEGTEVALSNQQVMDCSYSVYGRPSYFGCNGGFFSAPLYYAKYHSLFPESRYPYTARNQPCYWYRLLSGPAYSIQSWGVLSRNCDAVANYVLNTGTVMVAVYVHSGWGSYSTGVFDCKSVSDIGSKWRVNHAVVVVAVDETTFTIQNSWGSGWGDNGYMKIERDGDENCNACSYPYVARGNVTP